jgi:uncharacterized protein involved in exopolysaccharide biosynthesis
MIIKDIIERVQILVRYLLSRWVFIFISSIVGALLSILYIWMKPPVYEAKASFAIDEKSGGLSGALGLAAELGLNIGGGGRDVFSGENIIYILQSKRMIESVLLSKDTIDMRAFTLADILLNYKKNSGKFDNQKIPVFPITQTTSFTYKQDSILYEIQNEISQKLLMTGKPDKKYNIYEVSFSSPNERLSKIFTERLINAAGDYYTDLRTLRAKQNIEVLESRVNSMRSKASSSIQQQASTRDANLNAAFAKAAIPITERQVDLAAYGKAYEELFRNLELARYQLMNDVPLIQMIDPPAYPIKNKKAGRFKAGIVGGITAALLIVFLFIFIHQLNYEEKLQP